MRLKYIKLVGFKSFVDATKVPFPHQMTCVVGPNGCGKSNVIDAVRWVLGESSAKNLRGDAMTDVIFNGSTARKPVSQASVELVFDNSAGRMQGEYANYAEISVKRLVTRDGRSDYFLNGSKCRRRDITDLFLGTGLGPRSYAIIEQGMISRLIESKPQELRVFLEEAAGISKYKERRRETETRMQHTRDNLDRLNDVREELGNQLDKLQRQAAAARRYKELKQQERRYKSELQALRWLATERQAEQLRLQQAEQTTELERWLTEQRGSERGSTELREQTAQSKQQLEQVQHQFYQLGNEVTRLEQQLQHHQLQRQQRQRQQQQLQQELTQLSETLAQDNDQQQVLAAQLLELEPEQALTDEQVVEAQLRFEQHEEAWLAWQDDYQAALNQAQHQLQQQQQLHLQHERQRDQVAKCAEAIDANQQQQQQLLAELEHYNLAATDQQRQQLQQQINAAQQQVAALSEQLNVHQQQFEQVEQQRQQQQTQQQQNLGLQSALQQALKQGTHEATTMDVQHWLQQHQCPALGQVQQLLKVEQSWQLALEQLVQPWLGAWVITQPLPEWPLFAGAQVVQLQVKQPPKGSVAALVSGPLQQWSWLHCIAAVDDAAQAQQLLQQNQWLGAINQAGQLWLAGGYQASTMDAAASKLLQQQQLLQVEADLTRLQQQLQDSSLRKQQLQEELKLRHQELDQAKQNLHLYQADLRSIDERFQWQQHQQQQLEQRLQQAKQQHQQLLQQLVTGQQQQQQLAEQCEQATEQLQPLDEQHWLAQRNHLQQQRQQLREALTALQQRQTMKASEVQQLRQQLTHYQQLAQRARQQQQHLQAQLQQLKHPEQDDDTDVEVLALTLEETLAQRELIDEQRRDLANKVHEYEEQLRQLTSGAQGVQAKIEQARMRVQSTQMELAAVQERSRSILAVLADLQQSLKPILEGLAEDANETEWQSKLERIQQAISRLGAINLAAIEEAETLAERKQYLDQQNDDLAASLATLEGAIRTIDKETRQRFKATYDAVNHGLQELFPKVFGGGNAYLELTDDDLLETGVTIMARPPGKKNSTIHLLSGGEKALTALSLVFAIFRLNPAPFCLLDEVDAPLDDANVGRFCRLVEEMSQSVQFIYISHNKVAMEMASHLAGVTMQEPGVSRLVAVDIEQAVALTEA